MPPQQKIVMIVRRSKATRTAKLFKQQELYVARDAKKNISGKVLENTPEDGLEDEVPEFNKGSELVPFLLKWSLNPTAGCNPRQARASCGILSIKRKESTPELTTPKGKRKTKTMILMVMGQVTI